MKLRILWDEWILNGFHSILWANENDRCSSADNQTQATGVIAHFVWLFGITQIFLCVVQHQIQQWIVALENTTSFTATGKFHPNRLFQILAEIQNWLFSPLFLVFTLISTTAGLFQNKWQGQLIHWKYTGPYIQYFRFCLLLTFGFSLILLATTGLLNQEWIEYC